MNETPEVMFEKGKRFYLPSTGTADPYLAMGYFQKAAEAGYVPAQRLLGSCHLGGGIIPPNYQEAYKWLTLAAKQNDGQATCNLARMYINGLGVHIDWSVAYQLLDMKCACCLAEAICLKNQLIEALQGHFPTVVKALDAAETLRRFSYDAHCQRFIQPWNTQQIHGNFEIWLKMELKKITLEEGQAALFVLLNTYYNEQEALHPKK